MLSKIKYLTLRLLRDRATIFWTFLFPVLLATFYYFAFNNMMNVEFNTIQVGVEESRRMEELKAIPSFNKEDENYILKYMPYDEIFSEIEEMEVQILTKEDGLKQVEAEEIYGYVDNDGHLFIKKNGVGPSVINSILESIKRSALLGEKYEFNPDLIRNYVEPEKNAFNFVLLPFTSLLGMFSIYSMFNADRFVTTMQANLSELGKRHFISPMKKGQYVFNLLAVSIFVNFVLSNVPLFLLMRYVYKLDFLTNTPMTLFLMFLGNIFGACWGIFLTSIGKFSVNTRSAIMITSSLLFAFFSGMMSFDLKAKLPRFMTYINPVDMISTNIIDINCYGEYGKLGSIVIIILTMSSVLLLTSLVFLRRKRYDSL